MQRVLDLAQQLRRDGIDVSIDRFIQFPPEGWHLWIQQEIDSAAFVLVVFTERYNYRCLGREQPGFGKGVAWESTIISAKLYGNPNSNTKFIPVFFDIRDEKWIIDPMQTYSRFQLQSLNLDENGGYHDLYRLLTNQPAVVPQVRGPIRALPPLPVRQECTPLETAPPAPPEYPKPLGSNGKLALSEAMEKHLFGILREVFESHPIWVKTAVAIATQNLFVDRDHLSNKIKEVLAPLTSLPQPSDEPLNPTTLPLTHFVILLSEIAAKQGNPDLSLQLHKWLRDLLAGTEFNSVAVEGTTPSLPKQCLWAPAVEIAWNPDLFSRSPEVHIRLPFPPASPTPNYLPWY